MKVILTEEQLKTIIKEELGINKQVVEYSSDIFIKIVDKLKTNDEDIKIEKNELFIKKTFPLSYYVKDMKLSISVTFRNFLDKTFNKFYEIPYVTDGNSIIVNKNTSFVFINIYAISGTIVKEKAMETIQHEVEHIFQHIQMGKEFSGENLYAKIKTDIMQNNDVGLLMYYCLKNEQEAFSNGLYAFLMDKPEPYSEDLLKTSETYSIYAKMKEIFNNIKNGELTIKDYEKYGVTFKTIEKSINNFLHRIGKVIIKVKEDKIKQGFR